MERLDNATVIHIFKYLTAPTDIGNAPLVSRSWRQHALEGQLWRGLCHRVFPELELIEGVIEVEFTGGFPAATPSHDYKVLEKNHRVYNQLYREIAKAPVSQDNCIFGPIAVSSSVKSPNKSIKETVRCSSLNGLGNREVSTYWSSLGVSQGGNPVYSSKYVRFRLGYETLRQSRRENMLTMKEENCEVLELPSSTKPSSEYTWTYVSPQFPMVQGNVLQMFRLPRPVLCMGQILQVELLERVHDPRVQLSYIRNARVNVVGKPVMNFGFSPQTVKGACVLICRRDVQSNYTKYQNFLSLPPFDGMRLLAIEEDIIEQLALSSKGYHLPNTRVVNRMVDSLHTAYYGLPKYCGIYSSDEEENENELYGDYYGNSDGSLDDDDDCDYYHYGSPQYGSP